MKFAFAASAGQFDKLLIGEMGVSMRLVSYADPGLPRSLAYVSEQRRGGNGTSTKTKSTPRKPKRT